MLRILTFSSRVSATEYLEEVFPNEPSWSINDTVKLAGILAQHGVDLLDVSSGGNHPAQKIAFGPLQQEPYAYQASFAEAVRKVHGVDGSETKKGRPSLLVGAVGGIRNGHAANEVLEKGQADLILVGRQFQKDPGTVWAFAEQLGVDIKVAHQIGWAFKGRGSSQNLKKPEQGSQARD